LVYFLIELIELINFVTKRSKAKKLTVILSKAKYLSLCNRQRCFTLLRSIQHDKLFPCKSGGKTGW